MHIFIDKSFPFYKELCTIFSKDRATSEHAESPADAIENIAREELNQQAVDIEDDILDDNIEGIDFSR